MLAQDVFGIRSATEYLDRVALFVLGCCYPGRSRLHLQIKMALEIVELGILRRVTQLLHPRDRFPRTVEIAGVSASERMTIFNQRFHEWERRPVRNVRNAQRRCRSPILALERVTRWNCS